MLQLHIGESAVNDTDSPSELLQHIATLRRQVGALEQQQKLLLYTLSHDLRTPVMTILGFTDMLLADIQEGTQQAGRQYLERIRVAAQRQVDLIEALLKVSQLQAREPQRQLTELGALANECIRDLLARNTGAVPTFQIDALPTLHCDPELMNVVLYELLSNAIKFTRNVDHPQVVIGATSEQDDWTCFIRDNGIGFDPSRSPRLFQSSQRLHAQQGFEGAGMGLVIAAVSINKQDGKIWIESKPGEGTTVFFKLKA